MRAKNVIIQTVTYRPVWPAVSAPDFYFNVYLQCVFTDVTQIKTTYLLVLQKKTLKLFDTVYCCTNLITTRNIDNLIEVEGAPCFCVSLCY